MTGHELDELVGSDERLRGAHEALLAAGPPPEVPPGLLVPPGRRARRPATPRRFGAVLVLAGALVLAAFGLGYLVAAAAGPEAFPQDFTLVMRGTDAAPGALASLVVGKRDEAGNWPMEMTIKGLPALARLGRYELLLTRDGKPAASCGTFVVDGKTVVFLTAPYVLKQYDGWIVTRAGSNAILLRTTQI
jgi:hypothetical protein